MEKLLPIKFFEKRKIDEQLTEAGGNNKPPKWVLQGEALAQRARQLSGSMEKVSSRFEAYKREEHELPMVMITIIAEDALAKTHRKTVVDLLNSVVYGDTLPPLEFRIFLLEFQSPDIWEIYV